LEKLVTVQEHHPYCVHDNSELIHVDCACHVYPDGSVGIHDMCFRVLQNEVVSLCGPNGSGKSTLIEHLNGLLLPSSGSVVVMGKKLEAGSPDIWRAVGVTFQRSEEQLFAPTVLDDVMFGPVNMGLKVDDARAAALDALKMVGAEGLADKMPSYLSGGQRRLVCLAGVLSMKPRVIAMDEPTSDLDPYHTEMIEHIILDLKNKHGISVVIATHDLDLAARISDRVCVVKDGCIIAEGKPGEIFYDKALLESAGLKQPKVVKLYDDVLRDTGVALGDRPITMEALAASIEKIVKENRAA
jgi:cobalt/nickel transport system ATP-binding protein